MRLLLLSIILLISSLIMMNRGHNFDPLDCHFIDPASPFALFPNTTKLEDIETTFPLQKPDDEADKLGPEETDRRNGVIRHFRHFAAQFTDSSHHFLLSYGEACDPSVHQKWMGIKNLTDFYNDSEWYEKVCTFTRFLHCNPETKRCECPPKDIYGVDFMPNPDKSTDSIRKFPCIVKDSEPCYIFLDSGTWPGLSFRMSANLQCPPGGRDKVNKTDYGYKCSFYREKVSGVVSERCHKCSLKSHGTKTSKHFINFYLTVGILLEACIKLRLF